MARTETRRRVGNGRRRGPARMRGVSRLGRVVVLLLCVVVVAVLAGISLADPFHLRQARWFTAGLIAVALVLVTVLLATAAPRGLLRWVALVVGVAAVLGWAGFVYGASALSGGGKQVAEADDAGRRLVTLEGDAGPGVRGGAALRWRPVRAGVAGLPGCGGRARAERPVRRPGHGRGRRRHLPLPVGRGGGDPRGVAGPPAARSGLLTPGSRSRPDRPSGISASGRRRRCAGPGR